MNDSFSVALDRGVTELHVELRWDDEQLSAERLNVSWFRPQGVTGAEGPSPVVHNESFDWDDRWTHTPTDGRIHVRIGQDQFVTAFHDFEVCVYVAYGGEPVPDRSCFTAIEE